MATIFNSSNRHLFLAAQRAALTKALKAYRTTDEKDKQSVAAAGVASIINRAPAVGFTKEEVISNADIPDEVLALIGVSDAIPTTGSSPAIEAKEVADAMETTFGLERDLQRALRANISQIDPKLRVIDGGKEQSVPSGRIDILAADESGNNVIIELKAGQADRDAVGQILSYMGDVAESTGTEITRGIIVANDFTPRAVSAARVVPNVQLLKYSFKFAFQAVGEGGGKPSFTSDSLPGLTPIVSDDPERPPTNV